MSFEDWQSATHSRRFELVRHFLPSFFESDMVESRGQLARIASAVAAILSSGWMLLLALLYFKYNTMADLNLYHRMAAESANDVRALTAMCLCITSLLASVLWQSVYPSKRDFLSMAGWPVSPGDLFLAKFAALMVTFAAFLAVFPIPVAMVLSGIARAPLVATTLTLVGALTAFFFATIGVQGLLLNLLPPRAFERAMIWMQALLAVAGIGGFPLALWKGHVAMGAYTPSPWHAAGALLAAASLYLLSFGRYRALVIENTRSGNTWSMPLWNWVADPREQAILEFLWATVTRNRVHRLAVLSYAGLAVAWLSKSIVQLMAESGDVARLSFIVFPMFLLLATIFGLRHLFALPIETQANWMFQIIEREGRQAWLRATENFVYCAAVAPILAIGGVLVTRQSGLLVGLAWIAVAFGIGAIAFERLFRDWRKLPFTCTYLPGKRPILITAAIFVGAMPPLYLLAFIAHGAATNPASLLILLSIEYATWRYQRQQRMRTWGIEPMQFVESEEAPVETYDLAGEGTVLAQEQFRREWKDLMRSGDASPIMRPLEANEPLSERVREWLRDVPADLRFAMRTLRRTPRFAATIVFTLGIGLGLNAAFFTLFNAFLLRPLAVRDPGSLVSMHFETRSRDIVSLSMDDYDSLKRAVPAFTDMAASTFEGTGLEGQAARYVLVTPNYFHLLGVSAFMGRTFYPGEDGQVVVLSHRTWTNRFGSDPSIVGRKVNLNGSLFEVIGVTAPEFAGVPVGTVAIAPPSTARFAVGVADCWALFDAWSRLPGERRPVVAGIIGRLAPDANQTQAAAMATGFMQRLTASKPEWQKLRRVQAELLEVPVTWTALMHSVPLLIAFGLTMLIPCANAANILLARATMRQREFGTRLALGASRGRVVRQLLTEGIALSLMAAIAGLGVARVATHLFLKYLYATAPPTMLHRLRIPDLAIDARVVIYMGLIAGLTTLLFALAPAAQATSLSLTSTFRGEFRGFRTSTLRDWLVVAQVALCVMLMAGSALLIRGAYRTLNVERGYDATSVFAITNQSPEDARKLRVMLEGEPWIDTLSVMGRPRMEADTGMVGAAGSTADFRVYFHRASGETFRMFRQSLTRGRTFTTVESENQAPVAVITETMAASLWPGEDPLGKTFRIGDGRSTPWRPRFTEATVVGVTRDVVEKVQDEGPRPAVWFPDKLRPGAVLALRAKTSPKEARGLLNQVVARAPGSTKGAWVIAYQEALDWETYPHQATTWLASILGVVSLLITITGIYALISFIVSQRTKEIGIRMALGANLNHIRGLVGAYVARKTAMGLAAGVVLAIGGLQYISSIMPVFVNLLDVTAYLAACLVVTLAAAVAIAGPTAKACRTDPQTALRSD